MKFEELYKGKSEFRLGFLGGSITCGEGASVRTNRFSTQFTEAMNARVPETHFVEVNAGVGGTGSALGCFRLKPELLDKGIDMLFIEFAVNDKNWGDNVMKYYESIIRQVRKLDPSFPVVCLFAYRVEMYENGTPESVLKEMKIADYYKIPYIAMGEELYQKILTYGGDPLSFTKDGVHPNDFGYRSYVDTMMREIFKLDFVPCFNEKPLAEPALGDPKVIYPSQLKLDDCWRFSPRSLFGEGNECIACDVPGTSLEFDFEGVSCDLYVLFCKDSGAFDLYIDGKFVIKKETFDKYCLAFDRKASLLLADGLTYGKHSVKIVISNDRPENSEGHMIRIGAVMVG